MTTLFEQVRGGIEQLSPEAVYEECMAGRPYLLVTGQVDTEAREPAGLNGSQRAFGRVFAVWWIRRGELASAV